LLQGTIKKRNNPYQPASPLEVRMLPSPYDFGLAGFFVRAIRLGTTPLA
jgi:hypothetical protein